MRSALLACLVAGCYHASSLECAVSCSDHLCPSGLVCGADQLCHAGSRECSQIDLVDAPVTDDGAPVVDGSGSIDAPSLAYCAAAQPNLVACYEFEGNGNDGSPRHLNATSAKSFQPGKVGLALALDQSSAVRIHEAVALDLAAFTIEAWLDQLTPTSPANVSVVNNVGQYGMFVDVANEPYCAYATSGLPVIARSRTALQLSRWTHVACTYDGADLTLYVDGEVAAVLHQASALLTTGTLGTGIGGDDGNTDATNHFIGLLDQLRIFSAARPAAEICADAGQTGCH